MWAISQVSITRLIKGVLACSPIGESLRQVGRMPKVACEHWWVKYAHCAKAEDGVQEGSGVDTKGSVTPWVRWDGWPRLVHFP